MNATAKLLGLTPGEWEAIKHRLESDCIPEVLSPDNAEDGAFSYHPEDTELVIDELLAGRIDSALAHSEAITHAVLRDAIEGSVWAAGAYGESTQRYTASCKALAGAAAKVEKFIGVEPGTLEVPYR